MKVLDLFSGLQGWSYPFEQHGHDVVTIDNEPAYHPTFVLDIGDVDTVMDELWGYEPDVILASPPCQSFSVMTMGRMWTPEGEPKHPLAVEGKRLVEATLDIIDRLEPRYWIIENPRARLRTLGILDGIPRVTVTYCRYGEKRMKPTDLWGRFPKTWTPRPMCHNGNPDHISAPRGSKTGTQGMRSDLAAMIPYELADEIREAIEREI